MTGFVFTIIGGSTYTLFIFMGGILFHKYITNTYINKIDKSMRVIEDVINYKIETNVKLIG